MHFVSPRVEVHVCHRFYIMSFGCWLTFTFFNHFNGYVSGHLSREYIIYGHREIRQEITIHQNVLSETKFASLENIIIH